MLEKTEITFARGPLPPPWDARLARRLVTPLVGTWVVPNHLTTVRLLVGLAAAGAFLPGTYVWANVAAVLLVLSNFLDHTDGELARMSGKSSLFGHRYDLASDALVTVLLFGAMGVGLGTGVHLPFDLPPIPLGGVAGCSVALIFFLRMRIEALDGKSAVRQAALGGFETEDVLYLMPLCTLCNGLAALLLVAAVCAPLFAVWVIVDYRRAARRDRRRAAQSIVGAAR